MRYTFGKSDEDLAAFLAALLPGVYCCHIEAATWQEIQLRIDTGSGNRHEPGDCLVRLIKEDM
jgi:hypothetical protein